MTFVDVPEGTVCKFINYTYHCSYTIIYMYIKNFIVICIERQFQEFKISYTPRKQNAI